MSETLAIAGYGYCARWVSGRWRGQGGAIVALDRFRRGPPEGLVAVRADVAVEAPPEAPEASLGLVTMGTASDGADVAGRAAEWLARCGVRRAVYLSSTSVYGDRAGGVVTGETPVGPDTDMGRRRVAAERSFVATCERVGVEPIVMRMPGIYGPGRTIRRRLEAGAYAFPEGNERWTNRVHVADVASAVEILLARGSAGGTYLAADGTPFKSPELIGWACEVLGIEPPAPVPWEQISERARPFWVGSRRCDPVELTALGWVPRFGDFRSGHLASWAEEDA